MQFEDSNVDLVLIMDCSAAGVQSLASAECSVGKARERQTQGRATPRYFLELDHPSQSIPCPASRCPRPSSCLSALRLCREFSFLVPVYPLRLFGRSNANRLLNIKHPHPQRHVRSSWLRDTMSVLFKKPRIGNSKGCRKQLSETHRNEIHESRTDRRDMTELGLDNGSKRTTTK